MQFLRQMLDRKIENYQIEKRYLHKTGHVIWVQLNVSLAWNPDGTPRHFVAQIQDITQRKQMEEALRASEDEYRATFELAGIGKSQTDLQTGRFLRVNSKFCLLYTSWREESARE